MIRSRAFALTFLCVAIFAACRDSVAPSGVTPARVATLTLGGPLATIRVGDAVTLMASLADARGNAITNREVTWMSSASAIASVGGSGTVTGVSVGEAQITATSEGVSGTITMVVVSSDRVVPSIAGVSPATLVPGANATITGSGFDATAVNDVVTIGGVSATVLQATSAQLTVRVPCVQTGTQPVVVTAGALRSTPFAHAVAATQRTLPLGAAVVLTSQRESECNELVTAGPAARYLIAVFNASTSPNELADFEIVGNAPVTGALAPVIAASVVNDSRTVNAIDDEAARDNAHVVFLEQQRRAYPGVLARIPTAGARLRSLAALPTVGSTRDLFYSFINTNCSIGPVMHVKAIYVGTHSIIWEDVANSLQSTNNAALAGYYQQLGEVFDREQYESLKTNFGDPLRRDALNDGNQRVDMVFSERVNTSGAAAFVRYCDFLPKTVAPGSNVGEFFYGSVPTTAGSNVRSVLFPDGWYNFMGRTVVHEVKHIVSAAARVDNNSPTFESTWLEEGTARHAEELWVRQSLYHVAWKANSGFGSATTNGIYCDFHPENATCNAVNTFHRPSYGMRRHFDELHDKLVQPWNWSPYGDGSGQSGSVFYQTAWSLVRYAIDRYASSDAALLTALTNSTATGEENLVRAVGVPLDQLIGGWGLALAADDYPGLGTPSRDIQFPTWNLRDIYGALHADPMWAFRWSTPYPVQPAPLPFGAFTSERTGLRGGAHAYYEISGVPGATQLIGLRPLSGALSPNLRIAIARLQ